MGLLTSWLLRRPLARAIQLTNLDNPGGLRTVKLTGTLTLVKGSTAVVASGGAFLTESGANTVITFSSQPNVVYVVASVTDNNNLVLLNAYGGAASTTATGYAPAVNYTTLAQAVGDAQAHFQTRTNLNFDESTATTNAAPTTSNLNRCIWAGVALVDYYLYEYRGAPGEDSQKQAALSVAERRLNEILHNFGDGAFSPPVSDSVFNPSVGPTRLPTFDNERWGDISPLPPGPSTAGGLGEW